MFLIGKQEKRMGSGFNSVFLWGGGIWETGHREGSSDWEMSIKELKYKVPQSHHRVMCLCWLPVLSPHSDTMWACVCVGGSF